MASLATSRRTMVRITRNDQPAAIKQYEHRTPAPTLGALRCFAPFPSEVYTCTLSKGHSGPHVAHAVGAVVVAVWDREEGDDALREALRLQTDSLWIGIRLLLGCAVVLVLAAVLNLFLAGSLLIGSAMAFGWFIACRSLHPLDRPKAATGGPSLVILGFWLVLFVSAVLLAWIRAGWRAGVGAILLGFWVLPQLFRRFWLSRFASQGIRYPPL